MRNLEGISVGGIKEEYIIAVGFLEGITLLEVHVSGMMMGFVLLEILKVIPERIAAQREVTYTLNQKHLINMCNMCTTHVPENSQISIVFDQLVVYLWSKFGQDWTNFT